MSKLAELLVDLCSDGVSMSLVRDVFSAVQLPAKIKRSQYSDGTKYPIVDQGQSFICGYTDDEKALLPDGQYVVFGDHTQALKWVDFRFAAGADGTKVLKSAPEVLPKFGFYALSSLNIPSRGYNRHWTILRDLKIPVPSLEVQREIVRVLDAFTDLEQNLVSELELRKKQLEATRDSVYSLPSVLTEKFSDLGTIHRGKRFVKNDFREQGVPCIHYGEIYTKYGVSARESYSFVDPSLARGLRKAKPNDVIVASAGETVEDIGNGVAWIGDEEVVIHDACYVLRTELDPLYVSHFLRTNSFHDAIRKSINTSKISSISVKGLGEAHIPIPSLAVQREIVAKLSAFEALIQSLEQEIVLRRKQYDYYRDELLSFNSSTSRGA